MGKDVDWSPRSFINFWQNTSRLFSVGRFGDLVAIWAQLTCSNFEHCWAGRWTIRFSRCTAKCDRSRRGCRWGSDPPRGSTRCCRPGGSAGTFPGYARDGAVHARSDGPPNRRTWDCRRARTSPHSRTPWKCRLKPSTKENLMTLCHPVLSSHFLHPLGNYTRRAIFPKMCQINQSIKRRLSL